MVLMKINRELQEKILKHITEKFPESPEEKFYSSLVQQYGEKEALGTILYLEMHKMLICKESTHLGSKLPNIVWSLTKPTEKAFDFLEDDGGLSAILGVVTVKLHQDTIYEIFEQKIEESDIKKEDKNFFLRELSKMKDVALSKLIEKGIDSIPASTLIALLKTVVGN